MWIVRYSLESVVPALHRRRCHHGLLRQAFFLLLSFGCASGLVRAQGSLVNFTHLAHLTERIPFMGDSVSIVHIYSNFPDYRWTGAAESGPEGIACVDDAARAAVVFMRHYELRRDPESLARARGLLGFITRMQAGDGMFYNFILDDHTVNTGGKTSFKSFGWWAVRGLWAMAAGGRLFREVDSSFARELIRRVDRMIPHVSALLAREGETRKISGYTLPRWLPYESGADVASELLLGLLQYRAVRPGEALDTLIRKLAGGIMLMQDGGGNEFPYGLHRSWETLWHMWGNGQTQALAEGGAALKDTTMIASGEREARGFYGRLIADGFLKELDVTRPEERVRFEQIAYGVRPMAVGLLRLFEGTGNGDYLVMAGLGASWLFGNNVAGRQIYDPASGRCYDGIRDSLTVNLNAGAESTIEALFTLVEIERYPEASRYLRCRKVSAGTTRSDSYAVFRDGDHNEVTLARDLASGRLVVYTGPKSVSFRSKENIR